MFTEVTGNFYLDDDDDRLNGQQVARASRSWVERPAGRTPTTTRRSSPATTPQSGRGLSTSTPPWHVALTLAVVYGLQPDEPVLVEVGLL